ncbi:MAG: peptidoglycan-binding protein [Eubacteriales bacterium]
MKNTVGLGSPVASLQTMLRELGKVYPFMPEVAIDGIFGEETMEAVILFQKELYPPVTGIVTQDVWVAIREEAWKWKEFIEKPKVLRGFPEGNIFFQKGDEKGEIALFQQMFQLLSTEMEGFVPDPPTAHFTEALEENVIYLQKISALPVTGQLDRQTWGRLVRLYEVFIVKEKQ